MRITYDDENHFQGITIKPVVLYFRVKKKSETVESLAERITNRLMDGTKTAIEDIIGDNSEIPIRVRNLYKVKDKYKIYFSDYIKYFSEH